MWVYPTPAQRTSATGSWSASPSPGPGSPFLRPAASRPPRAGSLVCPEGVVGGVDARASEPRSPSSSPGRLGSPVNPGITTTRSLVFRGTYAGRVGKATSYRPFIGCIPGGGGGPRTPTVHCGRARQARASRSRPASRRSGSVAGTLARTTRRPACRGERLLRASHSVGLYTKGVPSAAELAAVRVVRVVAQWQILVSATRRGLPAGVRAEVQMHAECAR